MYSGHVYDTVIINMWAHRVAQASLIGFKQCSCLLLYMCPLAIRIE